MRSDFVRQQSYVSKFESSNSWVILSPIEQSIKTKIENAGIPLKDWDINIYRGVLTGFNDAFIISGEKRQEILNNCTSDDERKRTDELIRPILRGRDIKRYGYNWADKWLIFIPWHFPLQFDQTIQGASEKAELEFKKQYPVVYSHLLQYKKELSARNKAETGVRYEWYFNKPKIVWAELSRTGNSFVFDDSKMFLGNTGYILTAKNNDLTTLKYLLGFLNSRIVLYYLDLICTRFDDNGWRWLRQFVENIPIPKIVSNHDRLCSIVDKVNRKNQKNASNMINQVVAERYGLNLEEFDYINSYLNNY